ncbi:hypothetical protein SBV1_950034 [Verrucomicrobia bacterium]|nr:hypothetical protein SBV1_950034 [Verrucomicrobiota bacterium]
MLSPAIRLSAVSDHADEQADSESDSDRLIRVFLEELVGGAGACHGALFQFAAHFLRRFEGGSEALTGGHPLLAQVIGSSSKQFLAIMHHRFEVLN